ncbi:hypothetical protein EZV73_19460 [Acidaminobacter sp. JC074]|uniref:hypothetical protein n=1 Tax=Acidaminobacter sp. JC074 TaxID=2530199 RepID=UPI001F0EE492|nr:hypothetical protein [Acidaminobacter sp. JC074]MCH4889770.1 hypothetical protein [Acidaminobacter sp. JC074]
MDFLDFDLDLDGSEGVGPIGALAVIINIGQVPVALVFSIVAANFWILAMMTYFLPIEAGGVISGILLLPELIVSVFITKFEIKPLRMVFRDRKGEDDIEHKVLSHKCRLITDLEYGRLGQAEIEQEGASIVINVKVMIKEESFKKNEHALVFSKDENEDFYLIAKPLLSEEYYD